MLSARSADILDGVRITTMGFLGGRGSTPDGTGQDPAEDSGSRKQPSLFVIPITLSVGLMLASAYVGNRVFVARYQSSAKSVAANAHAVPSAPVVAAPPVVIPPAAKPASQPVPPQTSQLPETTRSAPERPTKIAEAAGDGLIDPQPGERYLQVSATTAEAARKLVAQLRQDNFLAGIAPGPNDGTVRVLVGPFADQEALERTKAQLDTTRPGSFLRIY